MIDPTNVNPNDLNAAANSQVDPNFLPKDSNVYIRTMNTDLSNLKSQGGEALPYVEAPVAIPNLNTSPTPVPNPMPVPPPPMPAPMPVPPPPPMPALVTVTATVKAVSGANSNYEEIPF